MEMVSGTSTVTLPVVGDDKQGTSCLRLYLGPLVPGEYEYRDLALGLGAVSNVRQ